MAAPPLPPIPDLRGELFRLVRQIPPGRVTTYGRLALALGDRQAARWIGGALQKHAGVCDLPVHRVVRVDGEVGVYAGRDPANQVTALEREGIHVDERRRVDLVFHLFEDFQCAQPLVPLKQWQQLVPAHARVEPLKVPPRTVAGLDVSYNRDVASAAYVEWDLAERQVRRIVLAREPVRFPYISGFLTFRELPVLTEVLAQAHDDAPLADVFLVDGSGLLHPRRAGIAASLGTALDHPTIGLTKKLLCGTVSNDVTLPRSGRLIRVDDDVLGVAVRREPQTSDLYLSPGHRIDLGAAATIIDQTWLSHRLPEPIFLADRESRTAATG